MKKSAILEEHCFSKIESEKMDAKERKEKWEIEKMAT